MTADAGWSLFLWGRNLTDKDYAITRDDGVLVPGQITQSLATPRTYGIEARFSF